MARPDCYIPTRAQTPRLLLKVFLIFLQIMGAEVLAAQGAGRDKQPKPATNPGQAPRPSSGQSVIKTTIGTMRRSSTVGKGLGVFAELENVADTDVVIYSKETVLVVPPDLTGKGICVLSFTSFLPTEDVAPKKVFSEERGFAIVLKPGNKYRVFWDLSKPSDDAVCSDKEAAPSRSTPASLVSRLLDHIGTALQLKFAGFVPGPYNFTVEGKAYSAGTDQYDTFVEKADLAMEIPEVLVIVGAILGGCLGFLVYAMSAQGDFGRRWSALETRKDHVKFWWDFAYKLSSAALLSVVVTILLSRLADTQFAIRVSVSDFWGAITIGFLSYFVGSKLIDQIIDKFTPKTSRQGAGSSPSGPGSPPSGPGSPASSSAA